MIPPMRVTRRPLRDEEKRQRYRDLSIFAREARRQARAEVAAGEAEELELEVAKAWNLITCEGPPCCPNAWLVLTPEKEFVYLQSWFALDAVDGKFPASHLVVARFPMTHRLVDVITSGDPIPSSYHDRLAESLLSELPECEVVTAERLPRELVASEVAPSQV